MKKRLDLPLDKQLSYDPESGAFHRLISRPNSPAGSRCDTHFETHGYRVVRVGGKEHRAHRLAWFMVHGVWPPHDIDHINRNRADNRLVNLRCATRSENLLNSTPRKKKPSKACGVYYVKLTNKWLSTLVINGKHKYLGVHITQDEAKECHQLAHELVYGI